ncbi:MAG: hypothetical protein H8E38_05100 [SAR324 cluster bacterium]|nr:hypothetical protein [SAR324 cluster bacterium]MBL7035361.1 hypothetical protein [SAR324 cluster bacterium]
MKIFYYFVFVLFFGACSVTSEETDETNYGTTEGTASSPVELTVGTAKPGSVGRSGYSYYKFTTTSGAGSYKLAISSLSIADSWYSAASMYTSIYSNSGYTSSSRFDTESCLADCTLYFDYDSLDNNTSYYLQMYGYGAVTYSLTVSKGGSEGSKNNPVELTLSTAHSGTVEGTSYYGKSYYKFTTSAVDNYTLTMTNSDSMDCDLYSDSGFSTYVSWSYNNCTAGTNLSETFTGTSSSVGLSANTVYYLRVEGESSTAKTTTYNITVAPEG